MTMASVHRRISWITLASVESSHLIGEPPLGSGRSSQTARPGDRVVANQPSRIESAATFLARPDAEQVALPVQLRRVSEVGAAVRERTVVDVLDLASLDRELHPELGCVHDRAHGLEGVTALRVERRAGQLGAGLDEPLVEAP